MDPTYLPVLKSRLIAHLQAATYTELVGLFLGFCYLLSFLKQKSPKVPNAPVYGYRSFFEPSFLLQIRFVFNAHDLIKNGYKKLKNVPFVLRRYDTDITVLPMKYLDELRVVSKTKLNGKFAQINNLVPRWTWTQVMMESDLHVRVLNNKLNPDLTKYVDMARSEFEYGWKIDIPRPVDWTDVNIQESIRMLVARMSAKVFMGFPACRNEEWLNISINFTYDMFQAAFTLRMFPPWTHSLVAHFIPARFRIRRQMKIGQRIVGALMQKHADAMKSGSTDEDSLLDWMVDNSTEKERTVPEMAARQCVLTLASIHTTSLGVCNLLFDLCAHPEWFPALCEEIVQVTKTYGQLGERDVNTKHWLQRLEKMDSFIVESQRFNPPILLNPQRIAMVPLTLKDGTHIPQGTRIAWAGHAHANDPAVISKPEVFDPMRSYRKRHASRNGENLNKFLAGQTDANSLSFGYGGQACPGRYFAVAEMKMVLARLLVEFDFAFKEGQSRPKTMYADENVFMDPKASLLMRKRRETTV